MVVAAATGVVLVAADSADSAEGLAVVENLVVEDFFADRQSEHDVSGGAGRHDPYGIAGRVSRVLSNLN